MLAVSGATVLIGAQNDNGLVSNGGAAYIYSSNTGQLVTKLHASNEIANDHFGNYVAIDGNTAVICGNDIDDTVSGAMYVFDFENSQWSEAVKINETNWSFGRHFGWGLAISGDQILAKEYFLQKVYLFQRSGGVWTDEGNLLPTGPGSNGGAYGNPMAFSGNTALISDQFWYNDNKKTVRCLYLG